MRFDTSIIGNKKANQSLGFSIVGAVLFFLAGRLSGAFLLLFIVLSSLALAVAIAGLLQGIKSYQMLISAERPTSGATAGIAIAILLISFFLGVGVLLALGSLGLL
jgi:hypothetical protein